VEENFVVETTNNAANADFGTAAARSESASMVPASASVSRTPATTLATNSLTMRASLPGGSMPSTAALHHTMIKATARMLRQRLLVRAPAERTQ